MKIAISVHLPRTWVFSKVALARSYSRPDLAAAITSLQVCRRTRRKKTKRVPPKSPRIPPSEDHRTVRISARRIIYLYSFGHKHQNQLYTRKQVRIISDDHLRACVYILLWLEICDEDDLSLDVELDDDPWALTAAFPYCRRDPNSCIGLYTWQLDCV